MVSTSAGGSSVGGAVVGRVLSDRDKAARILSDGFIGRSSSRTNRTVLWLALRAMNQRRPQASPRLGNRLLWRGALALVRNSLRARSEYYGVLSTKVASDGLPYIPIDWCAVMLYMLRGS